MECFLLPEAPINLTRIWRGWGLSVFDEVVRWKEISEWHNSRLVEPSWKDPATPSWSGEMIFGPMNRDSARVLSTQWPTDQQKIYWGRFRLPIGDLIIPPDLYIDHVFSLKLEGSLACWVLPRTPRFREVFLSKWKFYWWKDAKVMYDLHKFQTLSITTVPHTPDHAHQETNDKA